MDLSAGSLVMMLVVSSIGFSLFIYGKKQVRVPQLVAGLVMMGYPYVVTDALWMALVAGVVLLGLWLSVRAGW